MKPFSCSVHCAAACVINWQSKNTQKSPEQSLPLCSNAFCGIFMTHPLATTSPFVIIVAQYDHQLLDVKMSCAVSTLILTITLESLPAKTPVTIDSPVISTITVSNRTAFLLVNYFSTFFNHSCFVLTVYLEDFTKSSGIKNMYGQIRQQ